MKKAQSAMEFLMTYGWAILVVLIVISAFVYLGVLKPKQMIPRMCKIPGFRCADQKLVYNGALYITLTNSFGLDVRVDYINFSSETPGVVTCNNNASALDKLIMIGESEAVQSSTCSFNSAIKPGTRIKGFVTVTFKEPVNNVEQKIVGTLIIDVES